MQHGLEYITFYAQKHTAPLEVCSGPLLVHNKPLVAPVCETCLLTHVSSPVRVRVRYILWVKALMLCSHLCNCNTVPDIKYHVILNSVITAADCIQNLHITRYVEPTHPHHVPMNLAIWDAFQPKLYWKACFVALIHWITLLLQGDFCQRPGPRLNIKTVLSTYGDFHVKDKTAVRTSYL